ncbi:NYN domain-containing protein [Polyangium fumosum]|uniref:NYN domain-containing protein n=1 Tax=Polyangium fumosum TaxID=889272 RepID=A0A4V5PNG9_9BACT|nr:NYN domain-containing protein [Polyangium fumosum]TKD12372.1 NYN domain-containing protein [Polyangium fumosum]
MRVRVFIDYWNFQLAWNERTGRLGCDWRRLPSVLCGEASRAINSAGLGALTLEETRVYAGYEAGRENSLKNWLHNFLDRQPGVRVFTSERHWRKQPVHCRSCDTEHEKCPQCGAHFGRAAEKTVDARIVTDLVGLAWEGAYDVAILVSSDKDFIPAVEHVQAKNFKVINASWKNRGNELAKVCWASFEIDALLASLNRT